MCVFVSSILNEIISDMSSFTRCVGVDVGVGVCVCGCVCVCVCMCVFACVRMCEFQVFILNTSCFDFKKLCARVGAHSHSVCHYSMFFFPSPPFFPAIFVWETFTCCIVITECILGV